MSRMNITFLAITMVLCVTGSTQAVVETIDATVSAEVREFLGSDVINSDSAIESLGETTSNLPLMVEAILQQTSTAHTGAGVKTVFSDPRTTLSPDPNEFGIAVVGCSTNDDVAYVAVGSASETRNVIFTADEMGASEGTALTANSYFYLDGLLLIWSEQGSADLTGTSASMSLSVEQRRPGDDRGTTVLQASLSLAGPSSGGMNVPLGGDVTFTASGDLCSENVIQMDISDLLPELGIVQLVIIPDIAIPYPYAAAVAEPFTLRARIEGEAHNRPQTGAAVMLGVSLDELSDMIDNLTGQSEVGAELDLIIQGLLSAGLMPAKPLPDSDGATKVTLEPQAHWLPFVPSSFCGMLGAESAALTFMFAVMAMAAWRSRSY